MKKFILILVLCPILMTAQSASDQNITGVWRVVASSWDTETKQYADCEMIKFITNTRWASIFYWPKTQKFAGSGGGTHKWKNGEYVETCEYFTWDPSVIGSIQTFKMTIKDEKLIQEGHIDTDKFNYPYYAVHERLDKLSEVYENQMSPQGVWKLIKATYGQDQLEMEQIKKKYGQAVKIITPNYFIGTFFDKTKATVDGVSFGTHSLTEEGKYQETISCWSWDNQSSLDTQPTFDWSVSDEDGYNQKGFLNSEVYKNYLVDEQFERLEPIQYLIKIAE